MAQDHFDSIKVHFTSLQREIKQGRGLLFPLMARLGYSLIGVCSCHSNAATARRGTIALVAVWGPCPLSKRNAFTGPANSPRVCTDCGKGRIRGDLPVPLKEFQSDLSWDAFTFRGGHLEALERGQVRAESWAPAFGYLGPWLGTPARGAHIGCTGCWPSPCWKETLSFPAIKRWCHKSNSHIGKIN